MNFVTILRVLWARFQPPLTSTTTTQVQGIGEDGSPGNEYARRLREREAQLVKIRLRHFRLWLSFTIFALATCFATYLALAVHSIAANWIILPVLAMPMIVQLLTRSALEHDRVYRIARFYESGIARLRDEWRGVGVQGEEFIHESRGHLYASDLDLFGEGSIFELLCTARTGVGRVTLANWLLHGAREPEILSRQAAIRELRDKIELREEWVSVGRAGLDRIDSYSLREWGKAPPTAFPLLYRAFAFALPVCVIVLLMLTAFGFFPANWRIVALLTGVLVLEGILAALYFRKTRQIATDIVLPSFELSLLGPLIELVESGDFQCSLLRSLQSQLTHLSARPSRQIRTLARLAWLSDLRQSDFATFLAPLLAGTNLAIRIEDWRRRNQRELLGWLDALGQFESLLCLARYHYENPKFAFPTIHQAPALFRAKSLGHPLLDPKTRVTCDLNIDSESKQLMIVSGSNMSGKSTLLRSIGVNAVLALAGAPVCANRLDISVLRIACSISVRDSLRNDRSRFQAEVVRLKEVLDTARARTTLFLLDEMLGGTNSKDRLFGAQAVIEQLIRTGAIGAVTTHDLALTEMANALNGRVSNVHFEEHYADGQMRFDYKMLPGVLTRTNGTNVMAALGLLPPVGNP